MIDMTSKGRFDLVSGDFRWWLLAAGLVCITLLSGGCSEDEPALPPQIPGSAPRPPAPEPGKLVVVAPSNLNYRNFVPAEAVSRLEQEIVHNLYGGLFDPMVGQGYGPGLATEVEFYFLSGKPRASERPEAIVRITAERYWLTTGQPEALGAKIDAYAVAEAWRKIATDSDFPGASRFTSVVESIKAVDSETLQVVFRTRIEWAERAQEALGFRVFNPNDLSSPVPIGGGPFVLRIPPASERRRDLLPSLNYPALNDGVRPKIDIRTVPSARNRLRAVLTGDAQIALSIPPYYLRDVAGALTDKMGVYNVWALVFSSQLNRTQRRYLTSALNSQELLDAFLLGDSPNDDYLNTLGLHREKLLSPSIFPSTFEVFECIAALKTEGHLSTEESETADWIANPSTFGHPFRASPPSLPELKIAYQEGDVFEAGVANLVTQLKEQLDRDRSVTNHRVVPISSQGDWERIVNGLADGSSDYQAALIRFEYDRRCDVSVHFKDSDSASTQGGLFRWISDSPGGRSLQWRSGDLAKLRNAGYCDVAAKPALQIVRSVHNLAPAKFLFTMPSLIVYDGRITVGVNDEFALAGMKDWRFVPQQ